jgi:peptide/nickel transport system substrate-binding protein
MNSPASVPTKLQPERGTMENQTRREVLKTAAAVSVVIGVAGPLAACGSTSSSSSTGRTTTAGTQKRGGTLRVGVSGSDASETANPLIARTKPDYGRAANLFDPLVGQDAEGRPKLMLAQTLTPNKDATMWTLRLRSGITFHDGKPLTVDDVIYTLKAVVDKKNPGAAAPAFSSIDVDNLKKVDPLTLRIPCKTPFATLIETFAISAFSTIVQDGYDPKKPPVGTGPFKFVSFTAGKETVMERNPDYWVAGHPFVDKVIMQAFEDPVSQINALLAGQLDLIDSLSGDAINQVKQAGKQIVISEGGGYIPLTMRTDQKPFTDVRVRQAMRLLVDREQMRNLVYSGHGTIGNDIFGLLAAEYDKSIPQRVQDVEQAKSLLKAAGQSDARIVLTTTNQSQGSLKICQVFAQQANAAGVNVKVQALNNDAFFEGYPTAHSFFVSEWFNDYYYPNAALATISGATFPETGFNNPKYDALYKEGVATVNQAKRSEIAHAMQQIDYTEGGIIIPTFVPFIDAAAKNVKGLQPTKTGLPLNGYQFVDISVA